MYLHSQLSTGVNRHFTGKPIASLLCIRTGALHHQQSFYIIATGCTHGINESLLIFNKCRDIRLFIDRRFVLSCKDEMVIIVLELSGYLSPDSRQYRLVLLFLSACGRQVVVKPPSVPVVVEQHVEISIDAVVNDFLHTLHPSGVDGVVFCISDMSPYPCTRYTYRAETQRLDIVDDGLCSLGRLPGRLTTESALVAECRDSLPRLTSLKGVSQIPSGHHALSHIFCSLFHVLLCKYWN